MASVISHRVIGSKKSLKKIRSLNIRPHMLKTYH